MRLQETPSVGEQSFPRNCVGIHLVVRKDRRNIHSVVYSCVEEERQGLLTMCEYEGEKSCDYSGWFQFHFQVRFDSKYPSPDYLESADDMRSRGAILYKVTDKRQCERMQMVHNQ